jgi:DNA-binding sugar fermentation-stimulating protein
MGGKCVPGAVLLVKPARNKNGGPVGANAVNAKYGTPKCEFHAQLLHVDESALHPTFYPPAWVAAHPALGEKIAEQLLQRGFLGPVADMQTQVRNPCGTDMRSDFLLTHDSGTKRLVEVKTVVDTDYDRSAPPSGKVKCVFFSDKEPYTRTALFPWGQSNQKGPAGEKVVSARAIHHVHELTRIARGDVDEDEPHLATVLFVVVRGDAASFRPNAEACPSFCRALQQAAADGVQIVARRVAWEGDGETMSCYDFGMLEIEWPELPSTC